MKKTLLAILGFMITMIAVAQQHDEVGKFQLGAFGGISMPQGTYKDSVGRANNGFLGGIFLDKYFRGNNFGIGFDARMIEHKSRALDTASFGNGSLNATYNNARKFNHFGISFGPTYQFSSDRFAFEAFTKGGILFQQFPNYSQELSYTTGPYGPTVFKTLETINPSDKAKAWMTVAGVRFNYAAATNLHAFIQADYLTTIGKKFGRDESEFQVQYHKQLRTLPEGEKEFMENTREFYEGEPTTAKTFVQALNVSFGLKYTIGKKKPLQVIPEKLTTEKKVMKTDLQVVVKDKQTGLALSGVRVTIKKVDDQYTSITNSNGEAERVIDATPATYIIQGEKNGILTNKLTISEADFRNVGNTLYRELLHDDPRFTLIGSTVRDESNELLPGISTILTHGTTQENMKQISDQEAKFIYQLNQNAEYRVVANQSGKYSQTEQVSTMGLDRSKTLYVTLKLGVSDLVEGASWVLKNIHYDFDKSNIRNDAAIILDNVVSVLKQNPTLKIELSSHTDSRGNDNYNMALSQRRAESAVEYLVSRGISRDRLVAKGYGESRLVNDCGNGVDCSEAQHQENRRTEIKVLNY